MDGAETMPLDDLLALAFTPLQVTALRRLVAAAAAATDPGLLHATFPAPSQRGGAVASTSAADPFVIYARPPAFPEPSAAFQEARATLGFSSQDGPVLPHKMF